MPKTVSHSDMQWRARAESTVILPCLGEIRQQTTPTNNRDVIKNQSPDASTTNRNEAKMSAAVEWRKDDEPIATSGGVFDVAGSYVTSKADRNRFSVSHLNGSLTIHNVSSATDTGLYVCVPRRMLRRGGNSTEQQHQQQQEQHIRHIQLVVEGETEYCEQMLRYSSMIVFTSKE